MIITPARDFQLLLQQMRKLIIRIAFKQKKVMSSRAYERRLGGLCAAHSKSNSFRVSPELLAEACQTDPLCALA
jgi:hypothetical protein